MMPEKLMPLLQVKQRLSRLSATASRSGHIVITATGQPQSVLIGYRAFKELEETAALVARLDIVENIRVGLEQIAKGDRVAWTDLGESAGEVSAEVKGLAL
jgi:prevent-host-death family protein